MTYKGTFTPKNPDKYKGDVTNIVYRSLWERQVLRWADANPSVVEYSSEETIIPYRCKTDGRIHKYFVDLKIKLADGRTYLVEIKPAKQVAPPKPPARKTKRYIEEVMTYAKNTSKWSTAASYAKSMGWEFVIWTEHELTSLGIKLITG